VIHLGGRPAKAFFVEIVEKRLSENPDAGQHLADETFHFFCASDIVVIFFPTCLSGATPSMNSLEGCRQVSLHSIHHHFIEARLRIKLMSNDFSQWLHEDAGLTEPARALNRIDIYTRRWNRYAADHSNRGKGADLRTGS